MEARGVSIKDITITHEREIPGDITVRLLWRTTGGVKRDGGAMGALNDGFGEGTPLSGVSDEGVAGSGAEAAEPGMESAVDTSGLADPGLSSGLAPSWEGAATGSGGWKSQGRGTRAAGIIHVAAQTTPYPRFCFLMVLNSKSTNWAM